ncbi:4-hydroxythreonine-4-phosphate dehydrogenase PdxA [Paucidesulfovibrio longus]|uniref:4-hydroxythreonine-4-phosphate dehydrogenase PdxA n=1 Tax=Paucidesulfovibrio longus TaxID=889 RepID=UPI0009DB96D4
MNTILITLGDTGGLGPELVVRHFLEAASDPCGLEAAGQGDAGGDSCDIGLRYLLLGPESALRTHLGAGEPFWTRLEAPEELLELGPGVYLFEPEELAGLACPLGTPSVAGGTCAGVSLELAVRLLRDGIGQGLCTCPLNKAMLQDAGFDFPGHTEFLAERLGVGRENVCMHLGGPVLRVSLVTTHPRLRDVADLITQERILHCLRLTAAHMRALGVAGPIAVCGLNPHAGESGKIGSEEIEIIAPALEVVRAEGLDVVGPLPGDTVFHFAARGAYAAVLAMYHDQGLAPLKLMHFSEAVNVTLGLPYPRTSPDHGTGYDLAGKGSASLESFRAALRMVERMVEVREEVRAVAE